MTIAGSYHSAWPFVCRWYAVVVYFSPRYLLMELKHIHTNSGPTSINMHAGMQNGTIPWSTNKFAICADVLLDVEILHVNIGYESFTMRTYSNSCVFCNSVPIVSMTINSSVSVAENCFILRLWRCYFQFLTQLSYLAIVEYTSFSIWAASFVVHITLTGASLRFREVRKIQYPIA